ncbi:hypothetical protein ACFVMC_20205 [Nocardia sp. NPDC127579]|uniref:hypothetical protein n=1 Tax=Nocardia sp. NPDC127579 TaxID=3345402 RepID=UPI0036356FC2
MSALLPLLVAVPTVTGVAGYMARGLRVPTLAELAAPRAPVAARRPGVEYFDPSELTTVDRRGFVRQVETFRVEPWGLYMARSVAEHRFLQSWLLPELAVRVDLIQPRLGDHRGQNYRLGIGEYGPAGPRRWKAVDHYLEIVVRHGRSAELRGIGNLLAAHSAGLIDTEPAHRALDRATAAVDGLAACDHDVERWLAVHGVTLTWL